MSTDRSLSSGRGRRADAPPSGLRRWAGVALRRPTPCSRSDGGSGPRTVSRRMPALPPPSARRRRLVATSIAAALVLAVPIGAVAEDALKEARQELRETKERIRARVQKMREIQKDMNRIATRI